MPEKINSEQKKTYHNVLITLNPLLAGGPLQQNARTKSLYRVQTTNFFCYFYARQSHFIRVSREILGCPSSQVKLFGGGRLRIKRLNKFQT